jgi:hypothetical protein
MGSREKSRYAAEGRIAPAPCETGRRVFDAMLSSRPPNSRDRFRLYRLSARLVLLVLVMTVHMGWRIFIEHCPIVSFFDRLTAVRAILDQRWFLAHRSPSAGNYLPDDVRMTVTQSNDGY